jgi:hypothetical protein
MARGADGCTSPLKEIVLRILLPLKSHRSRRGLNTRTLSKMSNTLTARPPRKLKASLRIKFHKVKKMRHQRRNWENNYKDATWFSCKYQCSKFYFALEIEQLTCTLRSLLKLRFRRNLEAPAFTYRYFVLASWWTRIVILMTVTASTFLTKPLNR